MPLVLGGPLASTSTGPLHTPIRAPPDSKLAPLASRWSSAAPRRLQGVSPAPPPTDRRRPRGVTVPRADPSAARPDAAGLRPRGPDLLRLRLLLGGPELSRVDVEGASGIARSSTSAAPTSSPASATSSTGRSGEPVAGASRGAPGLLRARTPISARGFYALASSTVFGETCGSASSLRRNSSDSSDGVRARLDEDPRRTRRAMYRGARYLWTVAGVHGDVLGEDLRAREMAPGIHRSLRRASAEAPRS